MTPQRRRTTGAWKSRAADLLAWLQLGTCGRCGRARYLTRPEARRAARIAAPGARLWAYRCGDSWHLTTPAGHPQLVGPPVTAVFPRGGQVPGLDLGARVERAYGGRRRSGAREPERGRTGRWRRPTTGSLEERR